MKRREFITLLGGAAAAWPLAARAQQPERLRQVGVFSGLPNENVGQLYFTTFKQQLKKLGWVEGYNLRLSYRWAIGDPASVRELASEMVGTNPDAVLAMTTPALSALRQQTPVIPLIFVNISDPVDGGFVESIARPGGNITGFTSFEYSTGGKWPEPLKEATPSMARLLVVLNPKNYTSRRLLSTIDSVAPTFDVRVPLAEVRTPAEIETAIVSFAAESDGGFILLPDPLTQSTGRGSSSSRSSTAFLGCTKPLLC